MKHIIAYQVSKHPALIMPDEHKTYCIEGKSYNGTRLAIPYYGIVARWIIKLKPGH